MATLNRLFEQRKLSGEREGGKATQWGGRQAFAKLLVAVTVVAVLLLIALRQESQALAISSTITVRATIPVGGAPQGIAVNPNTNRIYVANEVNDNVAVIDGSLDTIVASVGVGNDPVPQFRNPQGVAVNPNTNKVYVASQDSTVTVIDGSNNTVIATIPVSLDDILPLGIAVNPNTNKVYVTSESISMVFVIDGSTNNIVATIPVGYGPIGIGVNPGTNRIYVAVTVRNVTVIDGLTDSVATTIPLGSAPVGMAVNPITNKVYATTSLGEMITIDGSTNSVVSAIRFSGISTTGIDVNPNTDRIYVVGEENCEECSPDDFHVIDGSTNSIVASIRLGGNPRGVAVNPNTGEVYVTGLLSGLVYVLEDAEVEIAPPGVNISFPLANGLNGWFVTSPVIGSVTADDMTTGGSNITAINCTGATVGTITGLGTPSASASLTVSGEGVNNVNCTATDSAGNGGAGPGSSNMATVQIDSFSPTILITSPIDGRTYLLNAAVASSYSCSDETSSVATCSGPVSSGANFSTSPVGAHAFTVNATDVAGNAAQATNDYDVIYNFNGFFPPVDNPGPGPTFVFNVAKAGSAIPVKFSLSGNQGLNIFDTGFPVSQQITCDASSTQDVIEQTVTAGSSSLSYDATTDQYVYVWKTNKGWANTCRQLIVQFNDGTPHVAYFTFTK